jgi:cytoskeleton protein RodZ
MVTHTDHDTHGAPSLDEPRPGQDLRAARERAGVSRESMAERLRLAPAQFDALEHDAYEELPPPAFVRGYFRAYARELGLDPDEYIAAYNRSGVSGQDPEIRSGGVTDTASGGRGGMVGLLLIALVAAGGLGAWWYQQRGVEGDDAPEATQSTGEERPADNESQGADPQEEVADDADTGAEAGDGAVTADDDGTAAGDGDADTTSAASGDDQPADAGSAAVDAETADAEPAEEDPATAAGSGGDEDADSDAGEEQPPTLAAPDGESSTGTPIDAPAETDADTDTVTAEATDTTAADGAADSGSDDDTGADGPAGDDNDGEAAAEPEPGATSPAATDSPTRAATAAAATGPDEITLEFAERSWLEVYDDRDRELVYTLYFGSEPITLQGWAPFEVFLGNSPAVTVRFNGEEIDKSTFTRGNNTARFLVDAAGARQP